MLSSDRHSSTSAARAQRGEPSDEERHVVISRSPAAAMWVLHCSTAGLCNRLRAVLSHRLAALELGCLLTVLWVPSQQCPGNFTDVFEALSGVQFVAHATAPIVSNEEAVHIESNNYHESVRGHRARMELCWAALALVPQLCQEVDENVLACTGDFVALHVRRTDHQTLYEPLVVAMQCQVSDTDFQRYCNAHPELQIFLATDCEDTQRRFLAANPARCHVGKHSIRAHVGSSLRQTSLRASAVDLFTCAEATIFKGSPFSSFSDAICHLRKVHGATDPRDEHTPELAPCDTPYWRRTIVASAHAQAARGNSMLMRMLRDVGVPLTGATEPDQDDGRGLD